MSFFRELLGYLSQVINFKDANVKRRLLASSSVNPDGSGDITFSEAADVSASTLHSLLSGQTDIVSFNELQHFTNYGDLPTNFLKDCENLEEIQFPVVSQWPTTYGTNLLANTKVAKLDLRGVTKVNNGATFGSMSSLEEVWINDLMNISSQLFSASRHPYVERVVISDESQWAGMYIYATHNPRPTAGGNATLYKGDLEHPITEFVVPSDVSSITHSAFDGIQGLNKIIIQSNVTCGDHCFRNLPSSTTIVGYEYITSIGSECFIGCKAGGITGVPSDATQVGKSAYEGSSIQSVTSTNLYYIDITSFRNCTKLLVVDIDVSATPGTTIYPKSDAFSGCTALTSVYLNPVTTIADKAFYGCNMLRTCNCEGLTTVGEAAFRGCTSLFTFKTGTQKTLVNVGNSAFYGCTNLIDVNFDIDELVSIGSAAFFNCVKLKCPSVFGNQLTKIGGEALRGCDYTNTGTTVRFTSASVITFEKAGSLTEAGRYESPFADSVTKIQVPSSLVSSYEADTNWNLFFNEYHASGNPYGLNVITLEGYSV